MEHDYSDVKNFIKLIFVRSEAVDDESFESVRDIIIAVAESNVRRNEPMFPENDPLWLAIPRIAKFCKECENELKDMKNRRFENTVVSYYNFIVEPCDKLARYVKDDHIVKEFTSSNYVTFYPIYASKLKHNFDKAVARKDLVQKVSDMLSGVLTFVESDNLIFDYIIQYLSEEDMARIAHSD